MDSNKDQTKRHSRTTPLSAHPYQRRLSAPSTTAVRPVISSAMNPKSPLIGSMELSTRPPFRSINTTTGHEVSSSSSTPSVDARIKALSNMKRAFSPVNILQSSSSSLTRDGHAQNSRPSSTAPRATPSDFHHNDSHSLHLAQPSTKITSMTSSYGSLPALPSLPEDIYSRSSPSSSSASNHHSTMNTYFQQHLSTSHSLSPRALPSSFDMNNNNATGSLSPHLSASTTSMYSSDKLTNLYIEHWQVVSKESARQITDLSLFMSMPDHSHIVTFNPGSYIKVQDAEVGQHAWFRMQRCTCETYRLGFERVRRPATIRDHLAKQACAPANLARLAELQLRMMRQSSKKLSNASLPDLSSPKLPPYSPSTMHSLFSSSGRSGFGNGNILPPMPSPALSQSPHFQSYGESPSSLPAGLPPLPSLNQSQSYATPQDTSSSSHPMALPSSARSPLWSPMSASMSQQQYPASYQSQQYYQYQNQHQQPQTHGSAPFQFQPAADPHFARSWPSSSAHHSMSSPFFGWSTDSEQTPSSYSMSTNSSDTGTAAAGGNNGNYHVFAPNFQCQSQGSFNKQGVQDYGASFNYGAGMPMSASMASHPLYDSPRGKEATGTESPLFGVEESLCKVVYQR